MKNEKTEKIEEGGGCGCTSSRGASPLSQLQTTNLNESRARGDSRGSDEGRLPDDKMIRKMAYGNFSSGLHCAEVVSKTMLELFSDQSGQDAIRCASGFGGGIAGSMEGLCGAFTGGIIAAGYMLGRTTPGESLKECANLIHAFRSRFLKEFGSIQCPEIIAGFEEEEGATGCVKLTARAAVILAHLVNDAGTAARWREGREKVKPGCCPFTGRQYAAAGA